jgi:hypothetical protein
MATMVARPTALATPHTFHSFAANAIKKWVMLSDGNISSYFLFSHDRPSQTNFLIGYHTPPWQWLSLGPQPLPDLMIFTLLSPMQ